MFVGHQLYIAPTFAPFEGNTYSVPQLCYPAPEGGYLASQKMLESKKVSILEEEIDIRKR